APDLSFTVSAYSYGKLASVTRYDSAGAQVQGTTFSYDSHERQNSSTDARNGATSLTFNDADLVPTVTTPAPATGQSAQTTTTYYYGFNASTTDNQPADIVSTTYSNDPASTASVTTVWDRRGRQKTITQGSMTTTLEYNNVGQLLSESYSGGTLAGLSATNG